MSCLTLFILHLFSFFQECLQRPFPLLKSAGNEITMCENTSLKHTQFNNVFWVLVIAACEVFVDSKAWRVHTHLEQSLLCSLTLLAVVTNIHLLKNTRKQISIFIFLPQNTLTPQLFLFQHYIWDLKYKFWENVLFYLYIQPPVYILLNPRWWESTYQKMKEKNDGCVKIGLTFLRDDILCWISVN